MSTLRTIRVKDLAVGHFVHLPGSWHTHPFFLSRFKITSQQDIDKIASLGYTTVTYDLERSDASVTLPNGADAPVQMEEEAPQTSAPAVSEERMEDEAELEEYQETLQKAFQNYTSLLKEGKAILAHVSAGRQEGLMLAQAITVDMARLLLTDKQATAISSLMPYQEQNRAGTSHSVNIATLAMMVGRELGLDQNQLSLLGMGGLLHDVGEERVPRSILLKRTPLTAAERSAFQLHPQYGEQIAAQVPSMPPEVLAMIGQHHEHQDGTGYPRTLKADAIAKLAAILSVIDAYEELTNTSSARSVSPAEALSKLYREQGTWYDGRAVVALIQTVTVYPPGTLVQLTDGTFALVMTINSQDRLRPLLAVYSERAKANAPPIIDLRKHRDLNIARSLRYDQVPSEVQNTLNPTRMIGYFVCKLPDGMSDM